MFSPYRLPAVPGKDTERLPHRAERVPSEGTTVLNAQIQNTEFVVEYEIVYIHTDEVIV